MTAREKALPPRWLAYVLHEHNGPSLGVVEMKDTPTHLVAEAVQRASWDHAVMKRNVPGITYQTVSGTMIDALVAASRLPQGAAS